MEYKLEATFNCRCLYFFNISSFLTVEKALLYLPHAMDKARQRLRTKIRLEAKYVLAMKGELG